MSARRGAAGLGAATALALTAGCGMLGIGGGDDDESKEDRLIAMLNESRRIEGELMAAENRIVQNCLEGLGFTVHDPWSMQAYEEPEQDALTFGYTHEEFLVPADEAAEWGFGQWANAPEGWDSSEAEDYYKAQEEKWEEEGGEWEEPDTADWDALTPEEQYDWYVAYQGEEYAEYSWGSRADYVGMMEEEAELEGLSEDELADLEAAEAAEEDGEIIVDESDSESPKPGGCQLEMIEALYGEPRMVEETYEGEGGSESWTYWAYRPESPLEDAESTMWEDIEAEYAADMSDLQFDFIDCISARGYEGWEFTEYNSLPLWEFFSALYYQNADEEERQMMIGDSDAEVPPIPEEAGDSFAEWKAYEIQTAVDFAECGEESGYAEASEKATDDAYVKAYSAIEEDVYAYQEQMNDAVSRAQELLDA